jgi:hypothetical protein
MEGMQLGQPQPQEGVPGQAPDAMKVRAGVQKALMLQVGVDEWFKGGIDNPDSLAARFSDYFEDVLHGHEPTNLDNPIAVQRLLEEIKVYKKSPESLH